MISGEDRQTLDSIEEGLAAAAPELVAMLATFARLNAGERMPTRESIRIRERAEPAATAAVIVRGGWSGAWHCGCCCRRRWCC